jgi:hypothetical protein
VKSNIGILAPLQAGICGVQEESEAPGVDICYSGFIGVIVSASMTLMTSGPLSNLSPSADLEQVGWGVGYSKESRGFSASGLFDFQR